MLQLVFRVWTLLTLVFRIFKSGAAAAIAAALAKYKIEIFATLFVLALVIALHFAPAYERVVFGVANVVTFGLGVVVERKYASVIDRFFPPFKI